MKVDIRTVLCPTDFSQSAAHALQYAVAIAERHGAQLELFHATEVSAYAEDAVERGEVVYEEQLRARLCEIAGGLPPGVPVSTHLACGVPYVEIVNRSKVLPGACIVMGTHGRTGLKHLLIGSVAERVVRTALCPVLTVRHPDHVVQ